MASQPPHRGSPQPRPPTITEAHPPLPLSEVVSLIRAYPGMLAPEQEQVIARLAAAHVALSINHTASSWRYRRARPNETADSFGHTSDLVWNANAPARVGRANAAGFSVLYIADRVDTALAETRVEDQRVTLTEFSIREGAVVRMLVMGEMTRIQRTGRGYLSGKGSQTLTDMMNACPHDEARSMLLTDAFLLDRLCDPHAPHERTSLVAMRLFERDQEADALVFPSVQQLGALNFVIRSDRVWRSWGVRSVREARAVHLGLGFYELSEIKQVTGIYESGRLAWSHELDPDEATVLLDPPWRPREADAS